MEIKVQYNIYLILKKSQMNILKMKYQKDSNLNCYKKFAKEYGLKLKIILL